MSNNPTEPENADVNVPIDRRIDQRLETVDMLDEATVRRLIDEYGEVEVDYDRLADEVAGRLEPGDLSETREALWTAFSPRFETELETGPPEGNYHLQEAYPKWGLTFRVTERTQLRGATVDAAEAGELSTIIYTLGDDTEDPNLVQPHPTYRRTNALNSGQQYVRLECSLSPGVYAIVREDGPPMRRTSGSDKWDQVNDTEAPVEFLRSFNQAYRPRHSNRYQAYDEGGWAQNWYYYYSIEFGHGVPE